MTFSIVARCERTKQLGVAVASHALAVGRTVPWARAGVGVVATQAMPGEWYGPRLLDGLDDGRPLREILDQELAADSGREHRQIIAVDCKGETVLHTGARCIGTAASVASPGFAVAGNMLTSRNVVAQTQVQFESSEGSLATRLVAALRGGEEAGGDIRGRQAAALIVVQSQPTGDLATDIVVDLRVDDHHDPILELSRLVELAEAHAIWRRALSDVLSGRVDAGEAAVLMRGAQEAFGSNPEPTFWEGVTLYVAGRQEEAKAIFEDLGRIDVGWINLLENLVAAGIVPAELLDDKPPG